MPRCGLAITHQELDLHTVQVYADGDPLVQLRRDPLRRVWLLPYPGADNDELVFGTPTKAVKQITWDAEHLSHTKFTWSPTLRASRSARSVPYALVRCEFWPACLRSALARAEPGTRTLI